MAKCKHDELEEKLIDGVKHALTVRKDTDVVEYEITCAHCGKILSMRVEISRYVGKKVTDWERVKEF